MKKRWIAVILVIVALIVAITVAVLVFKDKSQNDLLTSEINALSETNINTDVKTTGQYAIVEKLVKEDYKTYIESVNKLRDNYEKLSQAKVINLDNYQKDGPEFNESLSTLNGIKEENKQLIETLSNLVDETKIDEKAKSNGLEDRFFNLYKDIISQIRLSEGVNTIKEADAKYDSYNDSLIAVLTYMKDNANEWFIENNTLKSKSQTFIDEYNALVQKTNIEL